MSGRPPTAHNSTAPLLATLHIYGGLRPEERRLVADWLRLEAQRCESGESEHRWARCVGDEVQAFPRRPTMRDLGSGGGAGGDRV